MPKTKTSRQEKLNETLDMLEQGVKAFFDSDTYHKFITVMARFPNYSLNNQILIAMQMPEATRVAGFTAWKNDFNRIVKKNSKGIRIIAPMTFKTTTDTGEEKINTRFKTAYCFDVSQTEGEDLPELTHELIGEDGDYEPFLQKIITSSPVPVRFTDNLPADVYGCYSPADNEIRIKEGLNPRHACKTALHEVAHSMLDNDASKKKDRHIKECRAESIACLVCAHFGMPTDEYSVPYIASWSSSKEVPELKSELQVIRDTAIAIIDSIEKAA